MVSFCVVENGDVVSAWVCFFLRRPRVCWTSDPCRTVFNPFIPIKSKDEQKLNHLTVASEVNSFSVALKKSPSPFSATWVRTFSRRAEGCSVPDGCRLLVPTGQQLTLIAWQFRCKAQDVLRKRGGCARLVCELCVKASLRWHQSPSLRGSCRNTAKSFQQLYAARIFHPGCLVFGCNTPGRFSSRELFLQMKVCNLLCAP